MDNQTVIQEENLVCAPNYHPIPVVLKKGQGAWVWDVEGNKYLDMMSAYSAVNFGHCNERLLKALIHQAQQLNVVSRAYHTDKLTPFLKKAIQISNLEMALPMNTGVEGVESSIKAARRWGYEVKGIPENKAEVIVAKDNFHGRTITVTSFSTEESNKENFGPFTPGFKAIDFGDISQLEKAITKNTCAFLVEPIQGEAGVNVPEAGYLKKAKEICERNKVLLILDEVQTGLGRTGKMFAHTYEEIRPDGLILGKALGGGIFPVSLFLSTKEVLERLVPGSHGSTFGGNPLAAAIGLEVLTMLEEEDFVENSYKLGEYFREGLKNLNSDLILEIRGKGLMIGVEFQKHISARDFCERLMRKGILSKNTHSTILRLAPPLIIGKKEIDFTLNIFSDLINELK